MTDNAQLKRRRLRKLDPKAHIGYLVGYDSTNIFRVWIPHQGKVISTRDVIFDESTVFDGKKTHPSEQLIAQMDELVVRVSLDHAQAENEKVLEEDEEILDPECPWRYESDDEVQRFDFNEKDDFELVQAVEKGLITLPMSLAAIYARTPFREDQVGLSASKDTKGQDDELSDEDHEDWNARFESFQCVPVGSSFHGSFESHRR